MSKLLPYETILKAREGDPEAVNAVLLHYDRYIRYFSKVNGQVNAEAVSYTHLAERGRSPSTGAAKGVDCLIYRGAGWLLTLWLVPFAWPF